MKAAFAPWRELFWRRLALDILLDDGQRCPAARDDAIGPAPKYRLVVNVGELTGEVAADEPRTRGLEVGLRQLGREPAWTRESGPETATQSRLAA